MKRVAALFAVIALLVGAFVLRIVVRSGQFAHLGPPHFDGTCETVAGPVGPEDLTIDPDTGVAYISAANRRASAAGSPVPGAIYAYDLNSERPAVVNLTPDAGIDFQPHGISLWTGSDGEKRLFVVNHPAPGSGRPRHTIETFSVTGGALRHLRSLGDPLLTMPNDLLAVGRETFYVTNTHANPPGFWQQIETYFERRGANVVLFDGGRFRVAAGDLLFPNGINMSRDGRSVYVATTTPRTLLVFDRDPQTQRLEQRREVFLDSGLDNIEVDADGDLWIGAHPRLLAVVSQQKNPDAKAPAQVLRVRPRDDFHSEEVYLDLGRQISAVSVAAHYRDRLLIGQIFDAGFLDCRMR